MCGWLVTDDGESQPPLDAEVELTADIVLATNLLDIGSDSAQSLGEMAYEGTLENDGEGLGSAVLQKVLGLTKAGLGKRLRK